MHSAQDVGMLDQRGVRMDRDFYLVGGGLLHVVHEGADVLRMEDVVCVGRGHIPLRLRERRGRECSGDHRCSEGKAAGRDKCLHGCHERAPLFLFSRTGTLANRACCMSPLFRYFIVKVSKMRGCDPLPDSALTVTRAAAARCPRRRCVACRNGLNRRFPSDRRYADGRNQSHR